MSRRATERGLQILKQSAKGSKPSDAARLLAVGDAIGKATLGLSGQSTGHFRLHPTAPLDVKVVIERSDFSRGQRGLGSDLDTFTWGIEGSILVLETTYEYKHTYNNHPPGTDLLVARYRRIDK